MSGLSKKLDNSLCDYPCEGNETMACGGSLRLSVYELSASPALLGASGLLLYFCVFLAVLFIA